MSVKVIVPNKNYSQKFAGVPFVNGVGIFEDEALGRRIAVTMGYELEAEAAEKAPKAEAPKKETKAPKKAAAKGKKTTKKVED
ncbi:hypothetical protein [Rummeliibacillus stabekisii]|uniref:hypothetical protein n=1 Tax=Rummeliibacillus stabekisii TaxID=241244 RepID=UPI00371B9DC2